MIEIGLVSAALPSYNFSQLIDCVSSAGLHSVEVMCWPVGNATRKYSGVTHIDTALLNEAAVEEIKSLCKLKAVTISALGYYPNPLSPDKQEAEIAIAQIKSIIHAATQLGISNVNTFIGKDKTRTVEENLEQFERCWAPIIELAEQHKVKIGIENCPMYFTKDEWPGGCNLATTPAIWDQLFHRIDSPCFGLNYDPSHMMLMDMDYIHPLFDYKHKIFHVHLKDIKIDKAKLNSVGRFAYPLQYVNHKIPGRGDIDWSAFCKALIDSGYHGAASIELEDSDFESSDSDILQAIELSAATIRAALAQALFVPCPQA